MSCQICNLSGIGIIIANRTGQRTERGSIDDSTQNRNIIILLVGLHSAAGLVWICGVFAITATNDNGEKMST